MKRGGPSLRKELGDVGYLESHLEVCQLFKDSSYYRFYKKIQGSHQQVVEYFDLTFDGSKVVIGREEFHVDQALIAEVTEFPRTGESQFKTTITNNVEFRSYMKPEHKTLYGRRASLHPGLRKNGSTC